MATLNAELQVRSVNTAQPVHKGLLIPARADRPLRVVEWSGSVLASVLSRELTGHDFVPIHGMTPEAGLLTAWKSSSRGGAENPRLRRLFGIPARIAAQGNALIVKMDEAGSTLGLAAPELDSLHSLLGDPSGSVAS